jgi:hypothetical protein
MCPLTGGGFSFGRIALAGLAHVLFYGARYPNLHDVAKGVAKSDF